MISLEVARIGMMITCLGADYEERQLRLSPRRLRYTFACRLAAQGAAPKVIAELLDHTDLQHVAVYVETAASLVDRLSATIDATLQPIIDRYMGKIIENYEDVSDSGEFSPIPGREFHGNFIGGIGLCGSGSLCKLAPPMTCYICEHFLPRIDAPHERMLEEMHKLKGYYEERQQASAEGKELVEKVILHIRAVIEAIRKKEA